jgi:hypothetical protein
MAEIPDPLSTLPALIDKAHEAKAESPRPHLGASQIGHPCRRWLWLSFRWAIKPQFPGRILRLFRRGHHEENWIVEDLRLAGVKIHPLDPETGRQWFFKDGHFGGSLDGIIESGVPEAPEKPHVFEAKTHSLKSFDHLKKNGVEKSKPVHYSQMQVYMEAKGIDRALYYAVCKDNDEIYTERVRLKKTEAKKLNDKAQEIIASDRMPEPLNADPTWYQCRYCDAHDFCHNHHTTKEVNCRTCAHSTALRDGTWHCNRWDSEIPAVEFQRAGCDDHVIHPDLVPWKFKGGDEVSAIYEIEGQDVQVGCGGVLSRDLLHPDSNVAEIVRRFGGKVC